MSSEACCSHLTVQWCTTVKNGITTGWWQCDSCPMSFVPESKKCKEKTIYEKQRQAEVCDLCIKTYCQLATPCDRPADNPCSCKCHKEGELRKGAWTPIMETHTVELERCAGIIRCNKCLYWECQCKPEEPKPECEECGIAEKCCGKFCSPCRRTIEKLAMVNATIYDMKAEEKERRKELLAFIERWCIYGSSAQAAFDAFYRKFL